MWTWRKSKRMRYISTGGHCEICGRKVSWTQAIGHHIKPKSTRRSGEWIHSPENCQIRCSRCEYSDSHKVFFRLVNSNGRN